MATDPVEGFPPCGLPLGTAGEILVDVSPPNPFLVLGPADWTAPGLAEVAAQIPSMVSLVGATLATQGLFVDFAAAQPLRLTNGVELEIGVF